ncbi:MAG: hypothetical protein IPL39_14115 [Opitutaceae bacterium]|nr:hypothetical protein [Opitutaceae bacterium]
MITSPLTATATAGQPFTYRITASNAPDRFAVEGDVPGLGIVFATGVISGTCVEIGVYPLTISATNAAGTGEATLVLTVEPAPIPKPVITSPSAATTIAGRTFRYQITADHGPTWFGADDLPYGLVFDPIIGVISGRPWYYGDYTIPLRASNLGGTGLGSLALSVVVTADTYIAWAWARDLTGPGSAEGDDRDQDGLINLLEFALATDPFRSSSLQAPQGGFDPGSRSLLLTHRRTRTAQVVWTYETSSDLVTWSVCAPTITVLLSDADGDGSAEVVRAALPVAAAEGRRFLRVSVSEP